MNRSEPIVVAMSGGVDSATTAAMLVEAGHRVVGITMRLYNAQGTAAASGGRCCGPRDIEDARRVCAHLGIPFYVADYEDDFRERVVEDFVDTYLAGDTPNPCVRCNQYIKFTPLLKRARALGASVVATGHYARIEDDGAGGRVLRRGVDRAKDQSYFLFSMPREALDNVWFPLGGLTKDEVRAAADRFALPNAQKAESQEICFVPDGDYAGFVERSALSRGRPLAGGGDIVNLAGDKVGEHAGVHRYTIGQRRGLGAVGGGQPAYVVDIDREGQRVVVGPKEALGAREVAVGDVQWFRDVAEPFECGVQVRYRQSPLAARVEPGPGSATVTFDEPVVAASGQACVFYDGDTVVGGGWIRRRALA